MVEIMAYYTSWCSEFNFILVKQLNEGLSKQGSAVGYLYSRQTEVIHFIHLSG